MTAGRVIRPSGMASQITPVEAARDASPRIGVAHRNGDSEPLLRASGVKLRRELSLFDSLSINVGIIVGSGIFTSPGVVLLAAGSVGAGLLSWVVAGLLALLSSLTFAELGASIPLAGGSGAFFKVAFGRPWSFFYVWTMFFAVTAGSINLIATSFAQYLLSGISSVEIEHGELNGDVRVKYIAILCVVMLTFLNCAGVRFGAVVQNLLGACKAALVALVVVLGISFYINDRTVLERNMSQPFRGSSLSGFGPSMVAALWAFCGWGDVVFLAEEMKNPEKDIPRTAFYSIAIVTITYLAVNLSFLSVLPSTDVQSSVTVAMDLGKVVIGQGAGRWIAIIVSISLLGSINGVIMCGGRYLYGAAKSGEAHRWLGYVSELTGAPTTALIFQGAWSVLLLSWSSNFLEILSYFGAASFFIYGLSAAAQIQIRHKLPDLHRPYGVPFHPVVPIIVICTCVYLVFSTISSSFFQSACAFVFMFVSFPVYYFLVKGRNPGGDTETDVTSSLLM
ncbi:hypothetical protein MPTK1_6g01410 [Marchantia polymorpha subsp. ruderalis]|nr:hypothetical protein MARPO_0052s0063 [Marchantia polymorpha]PTQ38274.1 hypothetical protein MARPO_0052s0063 [Marchantia polymorpha]BBN13170.1 hypothetical protein Mp_6g01410 [Marchantia polymorpha subsp. ruderalis]BBN13171.1 hypothetical protein Mp_6g01410 [Marchantia polymorpha subsp. ruderalis]|eukprot:PTQ38273.1 hypothetical protein MARPO_0052s0063 [Marchantia polymorpha]